MEERGKQKNRERGFDAFSMRLSIQGGVGGGGTL